MGVSWGKEYTWGSGGLDSVSGCLGVLGVLMHVTKALCFPVYQIAVTPHA